MLMVTVKLDLKLYMKRNKLGFIFLFFKLYKGNDGAFVQKKSCLKIFKGNFVLKVTSNVTCNNLQPDRTFY